MKKDVKNAVIYTRIAANTSSGKQDEEMIKQVVECYKCANDGSMSVEGAFEDCVNGQDGVNLRGFKEMIGYIDDHPKIKVVIVANRGCLGESLEDFYSAIRKLHERGVALCYADDQLDMKRRLERAINEVAASEVSI